MEMFDLLERFGLPVMMVIALGYYAKSQTTWIQDELQKELTVTKKSETGGGGKLSHIIIISIRSERG